VRTLQSTRKKVIASTTAFRSNLLCELRELNQHPDRSDDPAPMFFKPEKPLPCTNDGSPKRRGGIG